MGEAGDDPMLVLTFLKSSSNRFLISASFSAKNFLIVGRKRVSISALTLLLMVKGEEEAAAARRT